MEPIYLDYNASTPIAPEVKQAMLPFLTDHYGNPSALHFAGVEAKAAVEFAREQVATLLHAKPMEIMFTSGGSESNNYVLKGVAETLKEKGNHIITSKIEHPAILHPCRYLEKHGIQVSYVDVDEYGRVNPTDIENEITDKTILISVMHSNNEVGTIQPIEEISKIAKRHHVLFHTDASQSIGKVEVDVQQLGVDFLTVAGHKLYAPKGIGALYIREGIEIESLIHGAGHEIGRRAGTENVLLTVGLGQACEIVNHIEKESKRLHEVTKLFWEGLKKQFNERIQLQGHPTNRLPNTLNVAFVGTQGQEILNQVPEIAASTGSACHAGVVDLSPVLKAMGVTEQVGMGAVRFSVGRYTTENEITRALELLKNVKLSQKSI
ncbi:cysteine desulfurase family protein [Alkalihalobacillus sp. LMS39]|uniref:cysteine desulfurase family protein n=1 Tax=Alkalihalobacillus sp. LMS39 TaxID=2924032 RepID=UPI001FB28DCF|nr:cysteine desulfurase family protein [Alkalihalobacillus sp. LMS39]UOE93710.1 cysteine desulfurase [Alkalihalobacillus sp. LMS39]